MPRLPAAMSVRVTRRLARARRCRLTVPGGYRVAQRSRRRTGPRGTAAPRPGAELAGHQRLITSAASRPARRLVTTPGKWPRRAARLRRAARPQGAPPQPAHPVPARDDQHLPDVGLRGIGPPSPPRGAEQNRLQQILSVATVSGQCGRSAASAEERPAQSSNSWPCSCPSERHPMGGCHGRGRNLTGPGQPARHHVAGRAMGCWPDCRIVRWFLRTSRLLPAAPGW